MVGGDFPGWLADLIGRGRTLGLADRRGECIYSACPHYRHCFIERSIRRARRAEHRHRQPRAGDDPGGAAAGDDEGELPPRYVFDEGHHLFDAADSAFAGHLTGQETAELRRWLLGAEGAAQPRARPEAPHRGSGRGRRRRQARRCRRSSRRPALCPARAGSSASSTARPRARPSASSRWCASRSARAPTSATGPMGWRPIARPPPDGAARGGRDASAVALDALLRRRCGRSPSAWRRASTTRPTRSTRRPACASRRWRAGSKRRGEMELAGWRAMLAALGKPTPAGVRRLVRRRAHRRAATSMSACTATGSIRRSPSPQAVALPAHGMVVTSATLTDGSGDEASRLGRGRGAHRRAPSAAPRCARACPRPSTIAAQTRVFIVTDVDKRRSRPGGRRLSRAVPGRGRRRARPVHRDRRGCAPCTSASPPALEAAGLPLLAQHVDGIDTATLVDIFRAEEDACLLGTDAVRDGVDVPGRSLRLIVFDRVPWPRPDILHRARKAAFGGARLRRRADAAPAEAGLRPADPPRRRPRRVRAARPPDALAPGRRLSRRGGGAPARPRRGGRRDAGVPRP